MPRSSTTWSRPPITSPTPSGARTCSRSAAVSPVTATRRSLIRTQTFGPELSKVHSKIDPGKDGHDNFRWVYSWIRDPQRYHKRSKMPNLFLETYEEKGKQIDPAADIAAFLLRRWAGEIPRSEIRRQGARRTRQPLLCRRRCGPNKSPASWTSRANRISGTATRSFRPT